MIFDLNVMIFDLNVMIPKFLNSLNLIILNKVNQKLKFLNFYFKKLQTESVANRNRNYDIMF
ncbi:hypothetical protein BB964_02520 [Campylobacter jejuni]|nr:hypothetical protein [Campylobacter jejuni]EAH7531339.1 hypothetical protein [Campylobacter jejuni]EAI7970107.1 hypothetical protein [Campylobacter jejuni]EAI9749635.1 hypothetical protein [Campylobacter jejuni]EAJ0131133.1 hypothetical protein [Campylobacter jejuni]